MEYLRDSHFKLGNKKTEYVSEQQNEFKAIPFCQAEINLNDKISHIKFHEETPYLTHSKEVHNQKQMPVNGPVIPKQHNILFGSEQDNFRSENKSQY